MKRKISPKDYERLKEESDFWIKEDILTKEKQSTILSKYEVYSVNHTPTIYVVIGLILVSIAFFFLIGFNLMNLSLGSRVLITFFVWVISFLLAEYFYSKKKKKHQFLYLFSALLFGIVVYGVTLLYPTNYLDNYIFISLALYCLPIALLKKQNWVWLVFLVSLFINIFQYELPVYFSLLLLVISFILLEKTKIKFFHHPYFLTFFPLYTASYFYIYKEVNFYLNSTFFFSLIVCLLCFSLLFIFKMKQYKLAFVENFIHFLPYLTLLSGVMTLFSGHWYEKDNFTFFLLAHAVFFFICLFIIRKHSYAGSLAIFFTILSFSNSFETSLLTKIITFLLAGILMIALALYYDQSNRKEKKQ